jgi:uncharacterized protein YndB with AHSA1/START domain
VFQAPAVMMFEAWTNPNILRQWWGPAGFTNTFHQFDLRPGGNWVFTMHGPEKGNYENECVFLEISKPELIAWERLSNPVFRVVTTFEQVANDQTKLIFRMQFENQKECNTIRKIAPEKNEENFDKLEVVLQKMKSERVVEEEM